MKNLTYIQKCFTILLAASVFFISQTSVFAQKGDAFRAGVDSRPFDFSDAFYLENGVQPNKIISRRNGADFLSVFDTPVNDTKYRNVRVLVTVTAYDNYGNMIFWNPLGELNEGGFTENQTGVELKSLADEQRIYVFPKTDGSKYALNNNRQSSVIDLQGFASGQNVLGLRQVVLVNYTKTALHTVQGQDALKELKERNGLAVDGTPIIKTVGEIEMLFSRGFVTLQKPLYDDVRSGLYAFSPVISDPQNGAIAADAFLWYVRQESGKPLEAESRFVYQFECLQKYGTWCIQ